MTLSTGHQLLIVGMIAGVLGWCVFASASLLDHANQTAERENTIARKTQEIEQTKQTYEAAFRQIDGFQAIFSEATCEIADIQNNLARLAEHGLGAKQRTMPHLEADAAGCQVLSPGVSTLAGQGNGDQAGVKTRIARLEAALDGLRASHGTFLTLTANMVGLRTSQLEHALKSVGLDPRTLTTPGPGDENVRPRFGQGGPFIAVAWGNQATYGDMAPVTLFNNAAARFERLNGQARMLPLGEPLADYEVTSPFGARNDPINFMTGIHEGVDLGAPEGTPVMATGRGVVIWAGPRERYGNLVEIDHGLGLKTRYAHLSRVLVRAGQKVEPGTPVGLLGSTGRTTGPHLHYEVRVNDRATNPMKFILAGHDVFKGQ